MKNILTKNQRIFIAGANGMVGSAIKRNLLKKSIINFEEKTVLLSPSRQELDIEIDEIM